MVKSRPCGRAVPAVRSAGAGSAAAAPRPRPLRRRRSRLRPHLQRFRNGDAVVNKSLLILCARVVVCGGQRSARSHPATRARGPARPSSPHPASYRIHRRAPRRPGRRRLSRPAGRHTYAVLGHYKHQEPKEDDGERKDGTKLASVFALHHSLHLALERVHRIRGEVEVIAQLVEHAVL